MSDLTQKLKATAIFHYRESKINDPRAIKLFYNQIKSKYYKLSPEEKAKFKEGWEKGKKKPLMLQKVEK